jgi:hypothetical protein
MGTVKKWAHDPPPNPEVIKMFEVALAAARRGHIQAATVVLVNPVHDVEHHCAGVRGVLRHSLIGGLSAAAQFLINGR